MSTYRVRTLYLTLLWCLTVWFKPVYASTQPVWINQITVLSADATSVHRYTADIVLLEGKIAQIGQLTAPVNAIRIDGRGKFLIPGLIDSHVHLANIAGMQWSAQRQQQALVTSYVRQLPKSYLYHGFTTIIDLNNYHPALLEQVASSAVAPRVLHCGAQLQLLNDFNVAMEGLSDNERRQLPYLALSADQDDANGTHSVASAVARVRQQRGQCLKIVFEDETVALPVQWQLPDLPLLSQLAQQPNLPLVMHAPSEQGHRLALAAKAQVLAHGLWAWPLDNQHFWQAELSDSQQQLLREIAASGMGYQPTLRTILGEADMLQGQFLQDPALRHVFPPAYLAYLNTAEGQWAQQRILQRPQHWSQPFQQLLAERQLSGSAIFAKVYPLYQQRLTNVVKYLSDHQANLLLGSDTPSMNLYTNPPGYNGFLEMKSWAAAGVPLTQIFRGATYNNAVTFGLDGIGAIQQGYQADLVILNADPLQDVNAYNDIDYVIRQGLPIQRAALSASTAQP